MSTGPSTTEKTDVRVKSVRDKRDENLSAGSRAAPSVYFRYYPVPVSGSPRELVGGRLEFRGYTLVDPDYNTAWSSPGPGWKAATCVFSRRAGFRGGGIG